MNATMKVASTSQQVVVNGNLEGDVAAINEQRTSENILNVMTADTIQNLPNQSVATVLGRMPGVTVQINEGEAQYVQIRGTEPRLSNTTLDGVDIPGPDPQVRQVDLWVIPGDLMGASRHQQDALRQPGWRRHRRLSEPAHEAGHQQPAHARS